MKSLFKRNKIKKWEIDLKESVLKQIKDDYRLNFLDQIKNNLFKRVLFNTSDIIGFVAFTYNHNIFEKYYDKTQRSYKFTNIKVGLYLKSTFYLCFDWIFKERKTPKVSTGDLIYNGIIE